MFDAAVTTSVLYEYESWLNCDIKPIGKQYKWCTKQLLGVRKTTNYDMYMVELGLPSLRALIKAEHRKFLHKIWSARNTMNDDPLMHAMRIVMSHNDQVSRYIKQKMKLDITNSGSNRLTLYKKINQNLSVHEIYTTNGHINYIESVYWTRLRLSAHSLAAEKGRWNRRGRGRLPLEERLRPCGLVKTETHVIESCPLSLHLRNMYNFTTVEELLLGRTNFSNMCAVVHEILVGLY